MYTRGSARALRIHSQRERAASAVHCVATRRRRSADGEGGRRGRTALFDHGDPTEDAALHALLKDDATCAPPPRRSCLGRRRESQAPICMCVRTACPLVHRSSMRCGLRRVLRNKGNCCVVAAVLFWSPRSIAARADSRVGILLFLSLRNTTLAQKDWSNN